jgi:hypothetical protein
MTAPVINTPRGFIVTTLGGKAELTWNQSYRPKWQGRFSEAQKFIDSEVLRLCDKYTPKKTGMMILSGVLGTKIGSGRVSWIAPYSAKQYYMHRAVGGQMGPLRGPFWFERMKATYGKTILAGARTIAKGGTAGSII